MGHPVISSRLEAFPGSLSHPPGEEPGDGRADGCECLHGGADGGRDPRHGRVGPAVLGDDVAMQVLLGESDRVDVAGDAPADPPGLSGRQASAAVAQVSVQAPAAEPTLLSFVTGGVTVAGL